MERNTNRIRTTIGTLAIALAAVLLLTACVGPRIYSTTKPGADLSSYSTFGFAEPLGTDRPTGARSILSSNLADAARGEMEKLGYTHSDSDPDLLVNFYLHTQQKIEATTTPSMGPGFGYYGYRGGMYSAWGGYETRVSEYTEGTLNIDLVDAARKELVWEGAAVGRLRESAREELQERVQKVVADVFAKFPLAPAQD